MRGLADLSLRFGIFLLPRALGMPRLGCPDDRPEESDVE
jgi:hypothetical protein